MRSISSKKRRRVAFRRIFSSSIILTIGCNGGDEFDEIRRQANVEKEQDAREYRVIHGAFKDYIGTHDPFEKLYASLIFCDQDDFLTKYEVERKAFNKFYQYAFPNAFPIVEQGLADLEPVASQQAHSEFVVSIGLPREAAEPLPLEVDELVAGQPMRGLLLAYRVGLLSGYNSIGYSSICGDIQQVQKRLLQELGD